MYVSVSCYNDADLLQGCLESVRETLPEADIAVVDGRYETFPGESDNSTDETADIAEAWGAAYHADGPYPRECDKHEHRVDLAPEGELCLNLDADERLERFDRSALEVGTAYQPRIYNAAVYGPKSVYWPRVFKPEWVESINRWDAYLFDKPCERTDAVTIVHRHDLRERDYRERKYQRFKNEDRPGRYDGDRLETYLNDEWDLATTACPHCGAESVTRSQITGYSDDGVASEYSVVETCLAGDRCYTAIKRYEVGEWEYLPEKWHRGLQEDPERLRVELYDAGCSFVGPLTACEVQRMGPAIESWVARNLHEGVA